MIRCDTTHAKRIAAIKPIERYEEMNSRWLLPKQEGIVSLGGTPLGYQDFPDRTVETSTEGPVKSALIVAAAPAGPGAENVLEGPAFRRHEAAQVHALHLEVVANVGNLCSVGFQLFHRKDRPL